MKPQSCGIPSDIAVDTASRPHYNAPARVGYRLTPFLAAEQGPAYAAYTSISILSACGDAVPAPSCPFLGEAATPQPPLISSPAGGATPSSALIPCLQCSCTLAPPASDAIATAAHACVQGHAPVPC